jgi:hypothetical protein
MEIDWNFILYTQKDLTCSPDSAEKIKIGKNMNKLFDRSSTLRHLRESVVGIEKIKDDPFSSDRIELEEYEKLIRVVRPTVEKYSACLHELNSVHLEMTRTVKKFYELSDNITERRNIDTFMEGIRSISDQYENGKETLTKVNARLDQLLMMHNALGDRLRERDKAHQIKVHYDEKVASLKDTAAEKVERNTKKHQEAIAEYQRTEEAVIRECRDALNTKYKDVDQIMGLYLKFFIEYYGNIGGTFSAMSTMIDQLMVSDRKVRDDPDEDNESPNFKTQVPITRNEFEEKRKELLNERDHDLKNALGSRIKAPLNDDSDSDIE